MIDFEIVCDQPFDGYILIDIICSYMERWNCLIIITHILFLSVKVLKKKVIEPFLYHPNFFLSDKSTKPTIILEMINCI